MVLIVVWEDGEYIYYKTSFRPLTGIMVLIRTPYKWLHSAIENAFCGADFLFSSFFTFFVENDFQKLSYR